MGIFVPNPINSILIVDDNDELRILFSMLLETEGYLVLTAEHGGEALSVVREKKPRLVLLDMNMPEVDGLQFLERLPREISPPLPIVVAMSANKEFRALAKKLGAFEFIEKPMSADILFKVIETSLSHRPMNYKLRREHLAQIERKYLNEDKIRDEIIETSPLLKDPHFHTIVFNMLQWIAGYFGSPMSDVSLLHNNQIEVFGAYGLPPDYAAGKILSCEFTYCADLIRANESLVLNNALLNPVYKEHPLTKLGVRFYVSVPIEVPDGLSLGTLCLISFEPAKIFTEDLKPLSNLAKRLGDSIFISSKGGITQWDFFPHPVFLDSINFTSIVRGRINRARVHPENLMLFRLIGKTPNFSETLSQTFLSYSNRTGIAIMRQSEQKFLCIGENSQMQLFLKVLKSSDVTCNWIGQTINLNAAEPEIMALIQMAA
jgi:CheY-like chemotaxis protein